MLADFFYPFEVPDLFGFAELCSKRAAADQQGLFKETASFCGFALNEKQSLQICFLLFACHVCVGWLVGHLVVVYCTCRHDIPYMDGMGYDIYSFGSGLDRSIFFAGKGTSFRFGQLL